MAMDFSSLQGERVNAETLTKGLNMEENHTRVV